KGAQGGGGAGDGAVSVKRKTGRQCSGGDAVGEVGVATGDGGAVGGDGRVLGVGHRVQGVGERRGRGVVDGDAESASDAAAGVADLDGGAKGTQGGGGA